MAQLINMLYNIVDRIYIGHMPGNGSMALTGVGGGAQMALAQAGIKLFGGVQGDADKAVEAYLNDALQYDPDAKCDHHDHEHGEGHTCGEHGCGGNCHGHN